MTYLAQIKIIQNGKTFCDEISVESAEELDVVFRRAAESHYRVQVSCMELDTSLATDAFYN
jgi:hypothetical protein